MGDVEAEVEGGGTVCTAVQAHRRRRRTVGGMMADESKADQLQAADPHGGGGDPYVST